MEITKMEMLDRAKEVARSSKKCKHALSSETGSYCILGAFCKAYQELTGRGDWTEGGNNNVRKFLIDGVPYATSAPDEVIRAFGLNKDCAYFLAHMNDSSNIPVEDLIEAAERMVNGA